VTALRKAIAERPKPADFATCGLVFVNSHCMTWIRETSKSHTDLISVQFGRLLEGHGGDHRYRDGQRRTADGGSDTTTRTFTIVVLAPVTTSTIITAATPSPTAFSEEVTFTVTVTTSVGNLLPMGTPIFKDGDTVFSTGTDLVAANGVVTATFVTTATQLGIGSHAITAVYAGNDLFVGSTSPELTQTVLQAATFKYHIINDFGISLTAVVAIKVKPPSFFV
jgi:hypothetical protein